MQNEDVGKMMRKVFLPEQQTQEMQTAHRHNRLRFVR